MFKLFLNKAFATLLTLLVLVSTVSVTVEKHFCGDHLIDLAYFSSVKTCGMESPDVQPENEIIKKSCCKNVVEVLSSQNELDVNDNKRLHQFDINFASTFVVSYANLFKTLPKKRVPHIAYKEPLLVYDISLVDQVFLI